MTSIACDVRARAAAPAQARRHGLPAGHPAEARARAVLRADPALRLRLHPLDDLSVLHPLAAAAGLRACRLRRLSTGCWSQPNWWKAIENLAIFGSALHRHLHRARPAARDPARPEDPRRGRPAADLSLSDGAVLHRHRHGLEVVPQSRPRPREDHARLGLRELQVRLAHQPRHGDLHRRHRRRLAGLGLRAWRCSWPACAASTARS